MRTIIVDGDRTTLKRFARLSAGIPDIHLVGKFYYADEAFSYFITNSVELVFIDLTVLEAEGLLLAQKLRMIKTNILIVFVSKTGQYLAESNKIGVDYYIVKPYSRKTLEMTMGKIRLLARRLRKDIYVQTVGGFVVLKNRTPVILTGKAKEILALVVMNRGKEISNKDIYSTLWEGREYSNEHMCVYYNAIRRLKAALQKDNCEGLLISTPRGQMVDTELFDCDFYTRKDNSSGLKHLDGEVLPEYPWAKVFH